MKRDMLPLIEQEIVKIEACIVKAGKKYGDFIFDDKLYYIIAPEERDFYTDGTWFVKGEALCTDDIHVEEYVDDADRIQDFDFTVQRFYYARDPVYGEVTEVEEGDFLYWTLLKDGWCIADGTWKVA